jgi:phospholipid/cholesterol/gamma-HCH transport system ATP-binding protein
MVEPRREFIDLDEDGLDDNAPPIEVIDLVSQFGETVIHDHLNLTVNRGEVLGVVGGSGSGKSVLLNSIIGLKKPDGGTIRMFGHDMNDATRKEMKAIERSSGVLFQQGALFSALTVKENVAAPMFEHTDLSKAEIYDLAELKIALSGLPPRAGALKPSELSGGMIKRAALARALALDPQMLFLDEPTSQLDPGVTRQIEQILTVLEAEGMTIMIATHDLGQARRLARRVLFFDRGQLIEDAPSHSFFAEPTSATARAFIAGDLPW